jgi:hypothetical protein
MTSTQRGYGGTIAQALNSRQAGFSNNTGDIETRPTNVAMLPCIKWQMTVAPNGIPLNAITQKGALITGPSACTPQALPVGTNGAVLRPNSNCALGLEWSNVGRTVTGICNQGQYITIDDLQFAMWSGTNKSFVLRTLVGCANVNANWSTSYCNTSAGMVTCLISNWLLTNADKYLGENWNTNTAGATQNATILIGPGASARVYQFTGVVGPAYDFNYMCVTRIQ